MGGTSSSTTRDVPSPMPADRRKMRVDIKPIIRGIRVTQLVPDEVGAVVPRDVHVNADQIVKCWRQDASEDAVLLELTSGEVMKILDHPWGIFGIPPAGRTMRIQFAIPAVVEYRTRLRDFFKSVHRGTGARIVKSIVLNDEVSNGCRRHRIQALLDVEDANVSTVQLYLLNNWKEFGLTDAWTC